MKESQNTKEMMDILVAETKKYMSPEDIGKFIYGSFGRLIATYPMADGENPFLNESLNVAFHAAELGLHGRYISCSMLYHPYLNKKISEFNISELFRKDDSYILQILNSLIVLGKYFDSQLPWIKPDSLVGNNKRQRISGKDNKYWEKQNIKQSTVAFLALAQNPETAIVKLLERMYLLKNISSHPEVQDLLFLAKDTIEIYSPVAEALGAWSIKSQLEDAGFKILQPEIYRSIAQDLQERIEERQARIDRAIKIVGQVINAEGINCEITGRPKHIFGIFTKLESSGLPLSEVNDILGIRIIVTTKEECYIVLSTLERVFHLTKGVYEFGKTYRDWIEKPKPNKYQSIHTTILFEGRLLEVQIRTQFMHDLAEYGVASHWLYRKAGNSNEEQNKYQEYLDLIAQYRHLYEKYQRRK